ncbi:hypothetical protein CPB83DRAFT_881934 [Crepidotus variabilis]|uniref:F-box domain-containing protein n=1 Tax=Crepidotus variabilis TaxID=179855 RepID=A0A9P6EKE5_9AGAR|nr:hypothetical protein CPB83DRAFT_881934 [Crepidotus variabilis]
MICDACGRSSFGETVQVTWTDCIPPLAECATLNDLQAEMVFIENMARRLAERRLQIHNRINSLTPIAQLPQEILTEVFRVALQRPDGVSNYSAKKPVTPLFLGSICKEWRQIAWSTPLLWNHVAIHVTNRTCAIQLQLLRDWLRRAKSSPLHIQIASENDGKTVHCSLPAILETLLERSAYWFSLDALLPQECHHILEKRHFPILKTVLARPPKGTISAFNTPPNMFLSTPNLRDVDLWGHNFSSMFLPWDQLHKFRTQLVTLSECLEVFRRSTNLKECRLESIYLPHLLSSKPAELVYSELELLNLSLIKGASTSLFNHLTLPNLQALDVEFLGLPTGPSRPFYLSGIGSLVARSGCSLQRLHIRTEEFHENDLLECLRCIPSLVHLGLSMRNEATDAHMGLTEDVIDALRLHQSKSKSISSILLPRLQSFLYRGPMMGGVGLLVQMVAERWRMHCYSRLASGCDAYRLPSRLKKADIETVSSLPNEVAEEIKQLLSEGMDLNISLLREL